MYSGINIDLILIYLKQIFQSMGSCTPQRNSGLTVATLNYSGILNSPFEFFSEQLYKEEKKLSEIFEHNLKTYIPNYSRQSFKWGLGKIDQKMQKERYAPIYDPTVGIIDGKLINKQEFMKQWDKKFGENIKTIKNIQYTQLQRQNARKFDYFCYKSIVEYVYNLKDLQKETADKLHPQNYKKFMQKFFSKAFLNENKKIKKTLQAMKYGIDIFFYQQISKQFIKAIDTNTFYVVTQQGKESAIVIRKSSFPKHHLGDPHQILKQKLENFSKEVNWNGDTVFAFIDNYILISAHLSSKTDKNSEQVSQMKKSLEKICQQFPSKHIIVGGDVNSYLTDLPKCFITYPQIFTEHTTMKTRTFVQPQVNKAQVNAASCRDHLITNDILQNSQVQTISGKNWKNVNYLPCQQHPYDHFVVISKVICKKQ